MPRRPKTPPVVVPEGGETHQIASPGAPQLTTNQGRVVDDDQNTLRAGPRGPALLEDHVFRDKMTHFDHERIPERVVHARGSGAHGWFEPYPGNAAWTRAAFLQDPAKRTPVFARFSTVAGSKGSKDTARDARGFAVKFYTDEGNFDLVGNNIPVFFVQDAMKFPDLVHAVKPEPDRGFPQAASAHDTFWDFVSLMPESMHMLQWVMSDRAIPRSFRMMEGFGVHTFRFVDAEGEARFVKFHWRPKVGSAVLVWDEAVKISGADPDFHRRDLWEAIDRGDFPEYELSAQIFDQATADALPFDVLDASKLVPEEVVPLTPLGRMVLDRNPSNFFAETEQVAFHPGHIVPGIDLTNDPLLQGRLFSYSDTQLIRLGGPNFDQIPINRPRCPMHNFARDGFSQQERHVGRVHYEPSSLEPRGPREDPAGGLVTHDDQDGAVGKVRLRPESFADHYSQARMFFRSMTPAEKAHIANAFAFELAKVETIHVRTRMLGHLAVVDSALGERVEALLGMEGRADPITPKRPPLDLPPSPSLSLLRKQKPTLSGRTIGLLVTDGVDPGLVAEVQAAAKKHGATVTVVAPRVGGVKTADGELLPAQQALTGAPSVLFDAVIVAASAEGAAALAKEAAAVDWVRDAWAHAKAIGFTKAAAPLLAKADVGDDEAMITIDAAKGVPTFLAAASKGRNWEREKKVTSRR